MPELNPFITAWEAVRCLMTGELLTEAEWHTRERANISEATARGEYFHFSSVSPEGILLKQELEAAGDRLIAAHVKGKITVLSDGIPLPKQLMACAVLILGNQLVFRDQEQASKHDPKMQAYPNLRILRSEFEAEFMAAPQAEPSVAPANNSAAASSDKDPGGRPGKLSGPRELTLRYAIAKELAHPDGLPTKAVMREHLLELCLQWFEPDDLPSESVINRLMKSSAPGELWGQR